MHEPIRVRVRLSQILFAAPQPLAATAFLVTAVVYDSYFIELAEFGEVHGRVAIEKETHSILLAVLTIDVMLMSGMAPSSERIVAFIVAPPKSPAPWMMSTVAAT